MESVKFEIEKEVLNLRRDLKTCQQQLKLSIEDKEHIISLLELKNTLMQSVNQDKPGHLLPLEVFSAMQKLSIFVLNRTNSDSKIKFDEHSQAIVRSVFNENSARMMDHYERRVEAQRLEIVDITKELCDTQQSLINSWETMAQMAVFQEELRAEIDRIQSHSKVSQTLLNLTHDFCVPDTPANYHIKVSRAQERIYRLMNRIDDLKTVDSVPSVHLHVPNEVPMASSVKSTKKKTNASASASPRPSRTPKKSSSNSNLQESQDLFN